MTQTDSKVNDCIKEFEQLSTLLTVSPGVSAGQMFGKNCLKADGKAFVAQHLETMVFKLSQTAHQRALALPGAQLWDPSGKKRPMKEWVALPSDQSEHFLELANHALEYVVSRNS